MQARLADVELELEERGRDAAYDASRHETEIQRMEVYTALALLWIKSPAFANRFPTGYELP